MDSEQRCAELIRAGRAADRLGCRTFITTGEFTATEARVANESLQREGVDVRIILADSFTIR